MRSVIMLIYKLMQEHYLTFRLLVYLKELGVTRRINFWIHSREEKVLCQNTTEDMQKSSLFFEDNKERVERIKRLLSDKKSVEVYSACIGYRCNRTPFLPEMVSENDQYFVKDLIQLIDGEVFVDCGAYTGDTVQQCMDELRKQKIRNYKIIAFEASHKYVSLLDRFFGKKARISIIPCGVSDKKQDMWFKESGAKSRMVEDGEDADYSIRATTIDCCEACKNASFIKMDIEGQEYSALMGAREVIKKMKPKLAICIYHSDEDMIRIIEYIHDLVPEYKLYVRHHSLRMVETVLYAVI